MHRSLQPTTNFSSLAIWRSRRIYLVGALGTIIEWYDFSLYSSFAHIFAREFFGNMEHWLSLLLVYIVFFISYLVRPLGGLLYGYIGDNFGRKIALIISISTMTLGMFAMMMLPTWEVAGTVAPVLLVTFRIIQGLSAGGETAGALIYVLESVNPKHQGFYGSAIWATTGTGLLLSSIVVALLMHWLPPQQLSAWGWRLTYLIAGIIGVIVFFLRVFISESIEFEQAKLHNKKKALERHPQLPIKEAFKYYKSTILTIISLAALPATIMYFIDPYFPQYISKYFSITLATAWTMDASILLLLIIGMVAFGALSDRIGRKRLITISACCILFFSYPVLGMISAGQDGMVILALLFFTMTLAMYDGPLPALLAKMAPLRVRYTVFALGFNVSFALFGGSAPLICSFLAKLSPLAPAFYFITLAALSLSVLYFIDKRPLITAKEIKQLSIANETL